MRAAVTFIDHQQPLVDAWNYQFEDQELRPKIAYGDIFEVEADAIVIAGNAFGFLDRGIELALCEHYGFELQDALRERIREEYRGELLVGQALSLPLPVGSKQRRLVFVAQYRTPTTLEGTVHTYLATRGAFLEIERLEQQGEGDSPGSRPPGNVVVPGIGSGNCGLHPAVVARQMRYAFEILAGDRGYGDKNLSQLGRRQSKLAAIPKSYLEAEALGHPPPGSSPPPASAT